MQIRIRDRSRRAVKSPLPRVFPLLVLCLGFLWLCDGTIVAQTSSSTTGISSASNAGPFQIRNALVKISQSIDLPVESAGVVTELGVREGQLVEKGDLIVRLNDAELQIQLERAKLEYQIASMTAESQVDIEYARKSRDVAAADLQRAEQANSRVKNSIPLGRIEKQRLERDRTVLQLEQAERDHRIAQLKARLAENEIKNAEVMLAKSKVVAPADGMIVSVESQPGEWVEPSQTLAQMVRVDRLRIEGFLPANSARLIEVGQPVTIRFHPDWITETVPGKIVFVSPEANPVNLNVQIWAEFENPDGKFLPGIRGDIEIESPRNR